MIGDLEAQCDWGYAGDYVDAMWMMLQCEAGATYVVGTGQLRSVRDWVTACSEIAQLDLGSMVREDPSVIGRTRVPVRADATKSRTATGWRPKVAFNELVRKMYFGEV